MDDRRQSFAGDTDVFDGMLDPRKTWSDGAAYDAQAKKLAGLFRKNFEQFAAAVSSAVREAGPRI